MKPIVSKLVELNLLGIDSNAFSIMVAFRTAARRQGTPKEEIEAVQREAMRGDYDHLLQVIILNTTMPEDEE